MCYACSAYKDAEDAACTPDVPIRLDVRQGVIQRGNNSTTPPHTGMNKYIINLAQGVLFSKFRVQYI